MSMAEVMVAIMFLSVAILGLISTFFFASRLMAKDRELHTATVLAASELADAEAALSADFDRSAGHAPRSVPDHPEVRTAVSDERPSAGLARVRAAVYYADAQGAHTLEVWTLVARP